MKVLALLFLTAVVLAVFMAWLEWFFGPADRATELEARHRKGRSE